MHFATVRSEIKYQLRAIQKRQSSRKSGNWTFN